jgi:hypothetical protein
LPANTTESTRIRDRIDKSKSRKKQEKAGRCGKGNSFFFGRMTRDGWMKRDKAYKV